MMSRAVSRPSIPGRTDPFAAKAAAGWRTCRELARASSSGAVLPSLAPKGSSALPRSSCGWAYSSGTRSRRGETLRLRAARHHDEHQRRRRCRGRQAAVERTSQRAATTTRTRVHVARPDGSGARRRACQERGAIATRVAIARGSSSRLSLPTSEPGTPGSSGTAVSKMTPGRTPCVQIRNDSADFSQQQPGLVKNSSKT
jgi:hypothetical protein